MSWITLIVLAVALGAGLIRLLLRRAELKRLQRSRRERLEARLTGSHKARLLYPDVDLRKCLGCGSCIRACPEEGVLDLLHGQAVVVHGSRCVGHGLCAEACPVQAIAVTIQDLDSRDDLPAIGKNFEATTVPGLYLGGELTGYALIRTAIRHGTAIADEVALALEREGVRKKAPALVHAGGPPAAGPETPAAGAHEAAAVDFLIVGAGPAGLACALQSKKHGLDFLLVDQETLGGTVSRYPRHKLVMTHPVELPLYGTIDKTSLLKEELIEIWERAVEEHEIPIRTGVRMKSVRKEPDGGFLVDTTAGAIRARKVCLALGRAGTPRKLGVPGEDLPKVAYRLIDASSYQDKDILVVGGGDSAVEAAIGLAEQEGNRVTLSYRRGAFTRIKPKNARRLEAAQKAGKLSVVLNSQVVDITPKQVHLEVKSKSGAEVRELPNDFVFIFAGGIPPFGLLKEAGVSFAPEDRAQLDDQVDTGGGLLVSLAIAFTVLLGFIWWMIEHGDYYGLRPSQRPGHPLHALLRPAGPFGIWMGVLATAAMVLNLAYLARRNLKAGERLPGTLKTWMDLHVLTGLLSFMLLLLHAAMAPRNAPGGHAFAVLAVVVATGAVGRWIYAFVPHAANGRELELEEVRLRLARLSSEWDRNENGFSERVQAAVEHLISKEIWRASLLGRLAGMLTGRRKLAWILDRIEEEGRKEDIPPDQIRRLRFLARQAWSTALMVHRYEDLRGILASWRYLHRWLALLLVILAAIHIATAVKYIDVLGPLVHPFAVLFGGGAS